MLDFDMDLTLLAAEEEAAAIARHYQYQDEEVAEEEVALPEDPTDLLLTEEEAAEVAQSACPTCNGEGGVCRNPEAAPEARMWIVCGECRLWDWSLPVEQESAG